MFSLPVNFLVGLALLTLSDALIAAIFGHSRRTRYPFPFGSFFAFLWTAYVQAYPFLPRLFLPGVAMAVWAWLCIEFMCGTLKERARQIRHGWRLLYDPVPPKVPYLTGPGVFEFGPVVLSPDFAQPPFLGEVSQRQAVASLVFENDRSRAKRAVRVDIGGVPVGHLAAEAAQAFRQQFRRPGSVVYECEALVMSLPGGQQVWLDLPRPA